MHCMLTHDKKVGQLLQLRRFKNDNLNKMEPSRGFAAINELLLCLTFSSQLHTTATTLG